MKLNLIRFAQYSAPIRLGIFVLNLALIWLPLALPIYLLVEDSNLESILTMVLLYGEFIFLVRFWGRNVYQQPQLLNSYGLQGTRRNGLELLSGLCFGLVIVISLFGLEGLLGWLGWQVKAAILPKLILEGLIVGLAVGFAEELLFRGWLLDELERDYSVNISLVIDALLFAALHFIKPLPEIIRTFPQFLGLLILGLILVWAKRGSKGLLGLSIGLHGGLIWGYYVINVGQLVQYSRQVPEWITGVNNNPLAGVMGVVFLSAIAYGIWKRSQK